MLQKLKTHELTVGMYVVDTGLSWRWLSFLYSQEGEIRSTSAILEIIEAGYEEVFIDLEKGLSAAPGLVPKDRIAALADAAPAPRGLWSGTRSPWRRISPGFGPVRRLSVHRQGHPGWRASRARCQGLGSPGGRRHRQRRARNPDALIALSKLRRHDAYTLPTGSTCRFWPWPSARSWAWNSRPCGSFGMAVGWFHDLGKTGVPDAILNKPGRLTPDEFRKVKAHPELGRQLLEGRGVSEGVRWAWWSTTKKYDGSGYPKGLAEDIHQWGHPRRGRRLRRPDQPPFLQGRHAAHPGPGRALRHVRP